ncbi:hypothetical protein C0J52_19382 [Blattella germanica]|nr:hypothetical protein C0J52_19382 [Blattella germanica]
MWILCGVYIFIFAAVIKGQNISNTTEIENEEPVEPTVSWFLFGIEVLEFVIGIVGNTLLLIICTRHKSMRGRSNAMIINLAVADTLGLCTNVPLLYILNKFGYTDFSCRAIIFLINLCVFLSMYTVVFLSYERFRAVTSSTNVQCNFNNHNRHSNVFKMLCLWAMGCINGIVSCIPSMNIDSQCVIIKSWEIYMLYKNGVLIVTAMVIVALFSLRASVNLRRSVRNFPGERAIHEERINNRVVASKTLIALSILFVVTYSPAIVLSLVMNDNSHVFLDFSFTIRYVIDDLGKIMAILNATCNPLVFCFLSSKFRKYFKSYIMCKYLELD